MPKWIGYAITSELDGNPTERWYNCGLQGTNGGTLLLSKEPPVEGMDDAFYDSPEKAAELARLAGEFSSRLVLFSAAERVD